MLSAVDLTMEWVKNKIQKKSVYQVPNTDTTVLDNTTPFSCSSIVSIWITLACSKKHKYHIYRQYWYTRNIPVFTNSGTFQYLEPHIHFLPKYITSVRVLTDQSTYTHEIKICIDFKNTDL